ncbi:hypothetical protein J5N97_018350 [Dioscorea zingiberensis]|uniref:Uncharacterized protein n=1 Tax=Dioscorea zingiberensis TaxID=325984 RepID=A0A9D5CN44_9LILI|nr:hypothetical protein J5N97_018350 [Dioscorea zingiberensis]
MDTSSPAVFVNAELLKMYIGRRVRSSASNAKMKVIGIADGNQSIRAEISTDLGENFDVVAYDGLCQLANGKHRNLFL